MKKEITAKQFSFTTISILFTMLFTLNSWAQQQTSVVVPHLVRFGGVLTDISGRPLTGTVGVTFSLYADQQAGVPLWLEMQNVVPDRTGHYSVQLGSTRPQGLPTDLFTSGEARWLGVQPEGQAEQLRVLLLSVPYALKAGDSETLGGLPASAFVLAAPPSSALNNAEATSTSTSTSSAPPPAGTVTGSGTLDFIPLWTSTSNIGNSALFQSGSGSTAKVGINTTTPAATLDVKGTENVEGLLTLPATGAAIATGGKNSQAEDFIASSFNSGTAKAVNQAFQWRAEPAGNNTTTPSGTLNLLFGSGTSTPSETGLKLSNKGLFTFATGQTFPGAGTIAGVTTASGSGLSGGGTTGTLSLSLLKTCTASQTLQWNGSVWACASAGTGTITGVTAGTDLTGGGTGGKVTLNVDTTKVAQLKTANAFTGNQSVTGNLSATGSFTGQTASFSASNSTQVVNVTQSGSGYGIAASSPGNAPAIFGSVTNSSGTGVLGQTAGTNGIGVSGTANNTSSGARAVGVLGYSASPNGFGLYAYETGILGVGVYGRWQSGSAFSGGSQLGVWGDSSNGNGVFGSSDSSIGVFGESGSGIAVGGVSNSSQGTYGESTNNLGVFGIGSGSSSVGGVEGVHYSGSNTGFGFTTFGVWGDTGVSGGFGVVGTTDDGNSLWGKNNSVNHETLYAENDSGFSGGKTPYAARFAGPGASTYCYIPRDTNDNGTGDLVCTGSKSAAVPVDGNRMVRLYAVEAADNWFEDAGSGRLSNGVAIVRFDPAFSQTINSNVEYHVFLTPKGVCAGLYVSDERADGFEVHEQPGGHANIAFDYRIMARRKGFESVRMQDVTAEFVEMKRESDVLATKLEAGKAAERARPMRRLPRLTKGASLRSLPLAVTQAPDNKK
jgi:hypothetical protein